MFQNDKIKEICTNKDESGFNINKKDEIISLSISLLFYGFNLTTMAPPVLSYRSNAVLSNGQLVSEF